MKQPFIITLIVVGAILIVAPLLFGYLLEMRIADLVAQEISTGGSHFDVHISPGLPVGYKWACLLAGVAVLWTGVSQARKSDSTQQAVLSRTSA